MTMEFILMGTTGLSRTVLAFEIAMTTSIPSVMAPKTGCFDWPGENQSRKELSATFKKNCEPPELGRPVFAIESVPGLFESFEMFSSWMLPPPDRVSSAPVTRFLNVPSGGPPVPERCDFGSRE
eukprot:CAMPEP_0119352148 /NCGR_PEP_ID=MMETSP1334-20130426/1467_1 /TAXON_ID=127549 /ORGANISM="Calcidiscus leptoporus, Strain RCC1130" /LENGTH=123 /DNA_ID=CAMNT_0007365127 /DNA_START=456 /DNA_END=827 /DNA_ORIENTATION=+